MKNLANALVLFVCAGVVGGAFFVSVDAMGVYFLGLRWPLHCLAEGLFGVQCAFCGMTRSFAAMAHGDFWGAMGYHRLGPAVFLFVVLQIPYRIWALGVSPRRVGEALRRVHAAVAAALLGAILVNWLVYLGGRLL